MLIGIEKSAAKRMLHREPLTMTRLVRRMDTSQQQPQQQRNQVDASTAKFGNIDLNTFGVRPLEQLLLLGLFGQVWGS